MKEWLENWDGGVRVKVVTEKDEHEGHDWEATETLADNSIEYTRWAYCSDCKKEFKEVSTEWDNYLDLFG